MEIISAQKKASSETTCRNCGSELEKYYNAMEGRRLDSAYCNDVCKSSYFSTIRKLQRRKRSLFKIYSELIELMNTPHSQRVASVLADTAHLQGDANSTLLDKSVSGYKCVECGHFVTISNKPKKCVVCKGTAILPIRPMF